MWRAASTTCTCPGTAAGSAPPQLCPSAPPAWPAAPAGGAQASSQAGQRAGGQRRSTTQGAPEGSCRMGYCGIAAHTLACKRGHPLGIAGAFMQPMRGRQRRAKHRQRGQHRRLGQRPRTARPDNTTWLRQPSSHNSCNAHQRARPAPLQAGRPAARQRCAASQSRRARSSAVGGTSASSRPRQGPVSRQQTRHARRCCRHLRKPTRRGRPPACWAACPLQACGLLLCPPPACCEACPVQPHKLLSATRCEMQHPPRGMP